MESNGFIPLYKCPESGSFQWSRRESNSFIPQQYCWLMDTLRLTWYKQFVASSGKSEAVNKLKLIPAHTMWKSTFNMPIHGCMAALRGCDILNKKEVCG